MLKPAVAGPALPLLISFCDAGFMAADAVGLHNPLLALRNIDLLRHPARIVHGNIPKPVDRFPHVIDAPIFVGKVTVHTLDRAMGSHAEPRLVIGLHGMAGGAEEGRLCLGHQVRGPETQEQADRRNGKAREKGPDENLPPVFVQSAHFLRNLTTIIFLPASGRPDAETIAGEVNKGIDV